MHPSTYFLLLSLVPELIYYELEIGEGGMASAFFESFYQNPKEHEINKIRPALLKYCELDTFDTYSEKLPECSSKEVSPRQMQIWKCKSNDCFELASTINRLLKFFFL